MTYNAFKNIFYLLLFLMSCQLMAQEKKDTLPVQACLLPNGFSFPGGTDSLKAFVKKYLKWPAPNWCGQGTVFTKFRVDCEGNISNITILHGIDSLANREALRIIQLMPKWIVGDCKACPQGIWYNFPVKFK